MAEDNRGWHGDSEGHAQAGKEGGDATSREKGKEFYEDIGAEGGSASNNGGSNEGTSNASDNPGNFANDPERASEAGRRGGEN